MNARVEAAQNGAGRRVLAVIPHAGLLVPEEIRPDDLAENWSELARNIDWHTDALYDFRDILANNQVVFPYCSLVLEANRDPRNLEAAVPLKDVRGRPVYRPGREPGLDLRRRMAARYLDPFHAQIGEAIASGAGLVLEGHATVSARGVSGNQIDLMNIQLSPGEEPLRFCPDALIEGYAEELRKRLPGVNVTINASDYLSVYGHIGARHSIDSPDRAGRRAPLILQETNQALYLRPDGAPDLERLNRLRRAFAESLRAITTSFSA